MGKYREIMDERRCELLTALLRHAGSVDIPEFVPATGRGEWQVLLYDQAGRARRHDSDRAQEQLVQASSLADRECGDLAVAPDVHVKNVIPEDGVVGRKGPGGEKAGQAAAADGVEQGQRSRFGIEPQSR